MRLVGLTDEGPLLFDVRCNRAGVSTRSVQTGLEAATDVLARLAWQAWGSQDTGPGRWEDDRWLVDTDATIRSFSGDPLILRSATGEGPDMRMGDYRLWSHGLLAYQVTAEGMAYTLHIALQDPQPDANGR
jgi:hypothetical protein